ncbi:MAG TPA: alanine racemase [Thermohalobaculum sp.]|nr:alanine racemase [Thermohalobaculum sp.]
MPLSGLLTIDLDAIAANWRALDGISGPGVETAAVVKADAYGLGVRHVAPALARAGARTFFVALAEEGALLRRILGPDPTLYVLDGFAPDEQPLFRDHDLRPVLNSREQAERWFTACRGLPSGIQLDSGMNRLGMEETGVPPLPTDGSVRLVMSHFACADEPRSPMNRAQILEFGRLAGDLALPGAALSLAATGGILLGPEAHLGLTRPGIGLYGGLPFTDARPAVRLDVPVIQVRDVAAGEVVGYGATWVADRPSRIATIAAGYADGLARALGNRASGWHRGRPLPFAGRVSMDLVTLDVTDAPDVAAGDAVQLLGPDQTIDRLADAAGTVGYEVLTGLGSRYRRRYRGDGSEWEPEP